MKPFDIKTDITPGVEVSQDREAYIDDIWQELIEKDDRTSPAEYPEMALITYGEVIQICKRAEQQGVPKEIALSLDAARRKALEQALQWVKAIHEGKDNSRDPAVVENICSRIEHALRTLIILGAEP